MPAGPRTRAFPSACSPASSGPRTEEVVTVALGDGPNDIPMLLAADIPIIVSNPASGATSEVLRRVPGALVTARPGPEGWRDAIAELIP